MFYCFIVFICCVIIWTWRSNWMFDSAAKDIVALRTCRVNWIVESNYVVELNWIVWYIKNHKITTFSKNTVYKNYSLKFGVIFFLTQYVYIYLYIFYICISIYIYIYLFIEYLSNTFASTFTDVVPLAASPRHDACQVTST